VGTNQGFHKQQRLKLGIALPIYVKKTNFEKTPVPPDLIVSTMNLISYTNTSQYDTFCIRALK